MHEIGSHVSPSVQPFEVDSVLQRALEPFSNSRLGNSIRLQLTPIRESREVVFSVSVRAGRNQKQNLPSLQVSARESKAGILVQYEILPAGIKDQQPLEAGYELGYLKSLVQDASQYFFMALSRAIQIPSEEARVEETPVIAKEQVTPEPEPALESSEIHTEEPESEDTKSTDTKVSAEETLGGLDLFEFGDDMGDNSVDLQENLEPLHIDL